MTAERGEVSSTPNQFTHEPERDMYLDVPVTADDLVHEAPDENDLPYDTDDEPQEEHSLAKSDTDAVHQLSFFVEDDENPSELPTAPYEAISNELLEKPAPVSTHSRNDSRPGYLRGNGQPGVARAVKDD